MRIVIDMQGYQTQASKNREVGRYTFEMSRALVNNASTDDDILLALNGTFSQSCDEIMYAFQDILPRSNIKIWQQDLQIPSRLDNKGIKSADEALTEYIREWYINQFTPDIIWSTNLQEGWHDAGAITSVHKISSKALYCSTLHDVIPLIYKEKYLDPSIIKTWYLEKLEEAKKSDMILTVSDFSKKKINELLNIPQNRIHVVYNAIDSQKFRQDEKYSNIKSKDRIILYVGGGDEHKNLIQLLQAYSMLQNQEIADYKLILVGKGLEELWGKYCQELGKCSSNIIFTGLIPDKQLISLMQKCAVFVFPSYSEGFGLPVLEAMACAAPVIAANAASLPEVVGLDKALFDPFKIQDLYNLLKQVLVNENFAEQLIQHGLIQARKFSWDKSAKELLSCWHKVLDGSLQKQKNSPMPISKFLNTISSTNGIEKYKIPILAQELADNSFFKNKKIYIDLSTLIIKDHATGIQRVVRGITKTLLNDNQSSATYEIIPIFSSIEKRFYYKAFFDGEKFFQPPMNELKKHQIEFFEGDILLHLDLHPTNAISKLSLLKRLSKRGVFVFFVIYDLLPIDFPDYFVKGLPEEFAAWLHVVAQSNGAICISKDVMHRFRNWLTESSCLLPPYYNLNYFYLGSDISNSLPSKGMPRESTKTLKTISHRISFLMVSTIEPRKQHRQVLGAMEILWKNGVDINFIIVGKTGWKMEDFQLIIKKHTEYDKKLFWFQGISDEYLQKIYAASSAVIMASEGEGFGLSIIEGAQYGKPLILRDIPVFREIAGEHAFYFKGLGAEELADALKAWLELYRQDKHPTSEGIERLTWKESAQMLLSRLPVLVRR